MGHNLAIVVGINEYERLKKLKYARQDALKVKEFLEERGEVESVLLFTDDSEPIDGKPTRATHTNLRDLFVSRFDEQFLRPEDNLWFFFSGHGLRHDQRDYLLPIDGNPRDIDGTCITVDFVTRRLSRSGAGNIVLILDACRNASEGAKGGEALGEEARERVQERGLISIFACRPDEQSWEEDALGQGIFTFALVKALEEGKCATVRQINSYLRSEIAELTKLYGKARQTPWMVAEPIEKGDLILSLKNVKEADLDGLKKTALEQEVEGNFDSALELWNRVNIASQGRDTQFYTAFRRIERKRHLEAERQQHEENARQKAEQRQREDQERLETQRRQPEEKKRLEAEQREVSAVLPGEYRIDRSSNPNGKSGYKGRVSIREHGPRFLVDWNMVNGDNEKGVGIQNGEVLGVGYGNGFTGLAVYRILSGPLGVKAITPWTSLMAKSWISTAPQRVDEYELGGSALLSGAYRFADGRAGSVTIQPSGDTYTIHWDFPTGSYYGIGVKMGDTLVAVSGLPGTHFGVVAYNIVGNKVLEGIWAISTLAGAGTEMLAWDSFTQ